MVDLVVLGVSLHSNTHVPVLLLCPVGTEQILCLRVDPMEAFSVSKALHGVGDESEQPERLFLSAGISDEHEDETTMTREEKILRRPMIYDFIIDMVRELDGKLVCVNLLEERNGLYFAEAVMQSSKGRKRLHCRPADGIALALRGKIPLRATESVMAHTENINNILSSLPEHIQVLAKSSSSVRKEAFEKENSRSDGVGSQDSPRPQRKRILIHATEKNCKGDATKDTSTIRIYAGKPITIAVSKDASKALKETGSSLRSLPDEEHWAAILSAMTPESKKRM